MTMLMFKEVPMNGFFRIHDIEYQRVKTYWKTAGCCPEYNATSHSGNALFGAKTKVELIEGIDVVETTLSKGVEPTVDSDIFPEDIIKQMNSTNDVEELFGFPLTREVEDPTLEEDEDDEEDFDYDSIQDKK